MNAQAVSDSFSLATSATSVMMRRERASGQIKLNDEMRQAAAGDGTELRAVRAAVGPADGCINLGSGVSR